MSTVHPDNFFNKFYKKQLTNYPFMGIIKITNSELGELVASITLANPFLFFLEVSFY
jgi:hypothetical protein